MNRRTIMFLRRTASAIAFATGAATPALAAVALPCADFISSRVNDEPVAGDLVGWEEITITVTFGHVPRTTTHYHGHYDIGGRNIVVDCATYRQIA
jgi:hypothetical protein